MASKDMIYIGSDHAGFNLKAVLLDFLKDEGYEIKDLGPFSHEEGDDFPDYAEKVCKKVMNTSSKGILICGTGQGMDRVANKFPGIRASVCWNDLSARVAKEHGNVNVICLAGRITKPATAKRIVNIWLKADFSEKERHRRRTAKIDAIERRYMKD